MRGVGLRSMELTAFLDAHLVIVKIFQYRPQQTPSSKSINHPGLAHIAFAVDDIDAARTAVLEAGGEIVGERTSVEIPNAGTITFQYLSDPEGNIIEIQKWN